MMRKIRKDKIVYGVMAVILLAMFIMVRKPFGDDFYYQGKEIHNIKALAEFLEMRYEEWSSRLFSETVIVLLLNRPMVVWRIFCVINILMTALAIKYLTGTGSSLWKNAVLCMLVASFPFSCYMSAGWITTTSVYLMSAVLGFFALYPIKKQMDGRKTAYWEKILYILAAVFACNHEQVCAILLGAYSCVCIYCLSVGKKISRLQIGMFCVCITQLLFIFTCPGNEARKIAETKNWLPEYEHWSIAEKLFRGFAHAADYFVYTKNINMLCLELFSVLAVLVVFRKTAMWQKAAACIGAVWTAAAAGIIIIQNHILKVNGIFCWGECGENRLSSAADAVRIVSAAALVLLVFAELYWLLGKSVSWLAASIIFAAGFGSAAVICFSPTIYASGNRVFSFHFYAVMFLLAFVLERVCKEGYGKQERVIVYITAACFSASMAKNMLLTVSLLKK